MLLMVALAELFDYVPDVPVLCTFMQYSNTLIAAYLKQLVTSNLVRLQRLSV